MFATLSKIIARVYHGSPPHIITRPDEPTRSCGIGDALPGYGLVSGNVANKGIEQDALLSKQMRAFANQSLANQCVNACVNARYLGAIR